MSRNPRRDLARKRRLRRRNEAWEARRRSNPWLGWSDWEQEQADRLERERWARQDAERLLGPPVQARYGPSRPLPAALLLTALLGFAGFVC